MSAFKAMNRLDSEIASHPRDSGSRASQDSVEDDTMGDTQIIVVGNQCHNDTSLQTALKQLALPIVNSDTGYEYMTDADEDTVFVIANFDSDIFAQLHRARCRIVGPPVIIHCAKSSERLPISQRPLYCTAMSHLILCFTGFGIKEELSHLADIIHHMGGSIRKDFSSRITHLLAKRASGEKFRAAVSMGTPIMHKEWVYKTWELRDRPGISANDEQLSIYKMSPFYFCKLTFVGFSKEEQRHMEETTYENGGTCVESGCPSCSHLVVEAHAVKHLPFEVGNDVKVVKSEWFWASIQMDACADESLYLFEEVENIGGGKSSTPGSMSKSRKRKWLLRENLAQLASEGERDTPMFKRRSNDNARMSFGASFLDATADTSSTPTNYMGAEQLTPSSGGAGGTSSSSSLPQSTPLISRETRISKRQQSVMELFQTEKNYVGILHTILKHFKEEVERVDQPGGPLLDAPTVKIIFGEITPLYNVHIKMRDELAEIVSNWSEDKLVGEIFCRHADALTKCYPPFVNYFCNTKETIQTCDRYMPRFHAFLKVCQTKQECGRQTLTELLIRPVQRLPSVLLILKEILKRTEDVNPDKERLTTAISGLEEVMTHINEDKRKADGHQVMFDIVHDIENCPASLLSSHRTFVTKVDVIELTDELSGRGDNLCLFIFSDCMELCKRRVKVLNSKIPHGAKTPQKAYKHLEVMPLSNIKRVVDIYETTDCKNVFALVTKKMTEDEMRYAFVMVDEMVTKDAFLTTLSKTICNNMCRADYRSFLYKWSKETLLTTVEAQVLNIDTSDIGSTRTLSKAATRFSKRVSRAFSLNRTPRRMKRAMSSMAQMSPLSRCESTMSVATLQMTPGSGASDSVCATRRLASVNDLTDGSLYSELVDQMSMGTPLMARSMRRQLMAPPTPQPYGTAADRRRDTLTGVSYDHIQQELQPKRRASHRLRRMSHAIEDSPIAGNPLDSPPTSDQSGGEMTGTTTGGDDDVCL